MEEKIKIANEIAKEIRHFEELYIHYKRLSQSEILMLFGRE